MSFIRHLFALALIIVATIAAPALQADELVKGDIHITKVWARPSVTSTCAAYLTITNVGTSDDSLIGVASDIAATTEMHEMTMTDMVMRMRKMASLNLPAGQSVSLAPGGMHIMLIGLKAPLKTGDSFTLSLEFEKAGHVELAVPVAANAASSMDNMDGMAH